MFPLIFAICRYLHICGTMKKRCVYQIKLDIKKPYKHLSVTLQIANVQLQLVCRKRMLVALPKIRFSRLSNQVTIWCKSPLFLQPQKVYGEKPYTP